jgi:phosphoribosylformimino-5-aminoimidazole carboxamide ribotide isomerase
MLIIPAIDIFDGKCVRLRQGDFTQRKIYSDSPADIAKQFSDNGFNFLHLVDLEGAKEGQVKNWKSIEDVIVIPNLHIEVGGGIRTTDDIRQLLDLGAVRIVIGSVAVKSPELAEYWIKQFGTERIVVGIDVKEGSVAIRGWLEDSRREPFQLILDLISSGTKKFICTDISRDGMLGGTNIDFFKGLRSAFPEIELIASGGISSIDDVHALAEIKLNGVIIGKALYEKTLQLEDLRKVQE